MLPFSVSKQARTGQVHIGQEEGHGTALGDLLHFGQVRLAARAVFLEKTKPRAAQQTTCDELHLARLAEAVNGVGQMTGNLKCLIWDFSLRKQRSIKRSPAQREVD